MLLMLSVILACVAVLLWFVGLQQLDMATIYDIVIIRMTKVWYKAVLERVAPGSRILDIGIGTATALVDGANKDLVKEKKLTVVGIDYEAAYIRKAQQVVADAGLSAQVVCHCQSIYEEKLYDLFAGPAKFDAAYFSGSLTLMPDPPEALKAAAHMLKSGGLIYVTQTFQNRPSPMMEKLKPLLQKITTIDFGRVTYHKEVAEIVTKAGMTIVEDKPVPGSIDNANQTARMLLIKPLFSSR